jgi:hypothetical protein
MAPLEATAWESYFKAVHDLSSTHQRLRDGLTPFDRPKKHRRQQQSSEEAPISRYTTLTLQNRVKRHIALGDCQLASPLLSLLVKSVISSEPGESN